MSTRRIGRPKVPGHVARLEQKDGEDRSHADAELDHEDAPVVGIVHRRPVAHPAADQAADGRRPEKQRLQDETNK